MCEDPNLFTKDDLTRNNPLFITPDKIVCGQTECPKVSSVMRIIWEDNRWKAIPPRTTYTGFTYRLNPEMICENIGELYIKDTCIVNINPIRELSIGGLLPLISAIFMIMVAILSIANMCSCDQGRDNNISHDDCDINAMAFGAMLGVGSAVMGGICDGDHNNEDYN